MYQERPSRLKGSVVWRRRTTPGEIRILPDGCMDLIWTDAGDLLVAGPDTRAHMFTGQRGRCLVGSRFARGVGPLALGVPASELRDQRVPLESIWRPADARRLADQMAISPHPGIVLEAAAKDRLGESDRSAVTNAQIVRLVRAGHSMGRIAAAIGISERQLQRRSLVAFGYGPKTLARILRLRRAVDLAGSGAAFADVAAETGYSDQAHLARDVRALAGVSLSVLSR
jgi:AraC-like DNA-binding protein